MDTISQDGSSSGRAQARPLRVLVVNGSPRGRHSTTIRFLRHVAACRNLDLVEIEAGRDSPKARETALADFLREAAGADLVACSYPVYTAGPPAQLLEFLNALAADPKAKSLRGKASIQVLSSKHFFDTTAMAAMRALSADLGLLPSGEFSADPDDLLTPKGRRRLLAFWDQVAADLADADPGTGENPATLPGTGRTIAILIDGKEEDGAARSLALLETELGLSLPGARVEVLDLSDGTMRGGCKGCLNCVVDGTCVYKDGYGDLMEEIREADGLVYVERIEGRWFRPVWKRYDDRAFRFGHRLPVHGKPFLFIVGGDMKPSPWLFDLLESRAHLSGAPLAGILADSGNPEGVDPAALRAAVRRFGRRLGGKGYSVESFWSVGGIRIFRDLVYEMRGFMREDHRHYKREGLYDFPHRRRASILRGYLSGAALALPAVRKKVMPVLLEGQARKYDKAIGREGREG